MPAPTMGWRRPYACVSRVRRLGLPGGGPSASAGGATSVAPPYPKSFRILLRLIGSMASSSRERRRTACPGACQGDGGWRVMPLTVRLLGPFDLRPLAAPCSRKATWLLALLALRPGREVDRAFLAGTLWPDTSESQALYDLRRELSRLRRALGGEAGRLRTPSG